jgi:hypothetical protein
VTAGRLQTNRIYSDPLVLLPLLGVVAAIIVAAVGHPPVGLGIGLGSLIAFGNSTLLLRRIHLALELANPGPAMIAMQAGLLVTFTVVGGLTVLTLLIDPKIAIAMAITFFFVQTGEIGMYFFGRAAVRGLGTTSSEGQA